MELARSRCRGLAGRTPFTAGDAQGAAGRAERSRERADEAERRADAAQIRAAQVEVCAASREADEGGGQDSSGALGLEEIAVGQDLAAVSAERMGWFRFYFDDHRWEWSDQVQRLHGYQPGTVTPTTELVLSHKHPDDRDQVATTIDKVIHSRGVFSSRHRIVDTQDVVHWVVVIGDQFFGDGGAVLGTHGFYIEVTPAEQARQELVSARVDQISDQRAAIEQVKGMLMVVYDIDADTAFGVLKWLSQQHNIKLRRLAEQIGTDLRNAAAGVVVDKTTFDTVLITAHQRLTAQGEAN